MKIIKIFLILIICFSTNLKASDDFDLWLNDFSKKARDSGISNDTINMVLKNARFLPKVIKYDRYQPEFYEDTKTYIDKRVTNNKIEKGKKLYKKNINKINEIEKKFLVEKELLLSLMGIETNYGNYLGKMDIISSLATLSYDKRRSKFFTNELLILLKLVDNGLIDYRILYGSWAGAFGNFQFMPSTINNYALDYDNNNIIDLKSINDSFASAANYINKIGWENNKPCFKKIELNDNIPQKFLNTSAQKIKNKKKLKYFKKYINNFEKIEMYKNLNSAIVTPDKDIVDNADILSPAYIVFDNYELILKWNRSLRFALAVCTLKDNFKNVL
tara:strand:- start:127 stop:1119 length:993 start_codon:yes stop_codon:yes gene_type:complete